MSYVNKLNYRKYLKLKLFHFCKKYGAIFKQAKNFKKNKII